MSSDENVTQFMDITGTNRDIASMFLDRSNGNLDEAISNFFADDQAQRQDASASPDPHLKPAPLPAKAPTKSNFATLSSINSDEKPRDPNQQAFYAGGSTSSGQQILGPESSGKKVDSQNLVQKMFEEAMKHQDEEFMTPEEKKKKAQIFAGTGQTLGETGSDSRVVYGGPLPRSSGTASDSEDESRETILKLWEDGFSIDDGPLRGYQTPENQAFLADIQKGQVPKELALAAMKRGQKLSMAMEDHRDEKYQAPKKKAQPFGGSGNRLGNPTDEGTSSRTAPPSQPQSSSASAPSAPAAKSTEETANEFLNLQAGEPNTRIQIRLPDGTRLIPQINLSRPVSDLRRYVELARPDQAGKPFNFMSTFPNKVIDNEAQSIKDAGLANASIVMRYV